MLLSRMAAARLLFMEKYQGGYQTIEGVREHIKNAQWAIEGAGEAIEETRRWRDSNWVPISTIQ